MSKHTSSKTKKIQVRSVRVGHVIVIRSGIEEGRYRVMSVQKHWGFRRINWSLPINGQIGRAFKCRREGKGTRVYMLFRTNPTGPIHVASKL